MKSLCACEAASLKSKYLKTYMEYYNAFNSISVCSHHIKQNICGSRAKYRDGKKDTAVKVTWYLQTKLFFHF